MQLGLSILAALLLTGWRLDARAAVLVFLVLFYSNAYNFSDGLDGLAGGLLVTFCAGLFGIGVWNGVGIAPLLLLLLLVGAVIPFLFLNAPPAKIFMGDVGSLPIGAVLGLIVSVFAVPSLMVGPPAGQAATALSTAGLPTVWLALTVASLMMIAELVPVPLQIASVKLRKKKLFPYTPIHHAFEKAGWPESRVVWTFVLCQLLFSALAVTVVYQSQTH